MNDGRNGIGVCGGSIKLRLRTHTPPKGVLKFKFVCMQSPGEMSRIRFDKLSCVWQVCVCVCVDARHGWLADALIACVRNNVR